MSQMIDKDQTKLCIVFKKNESLSKIKTAHEVLTYKKSPKLSC